MLIKATLDASRQSLEAAFASKHLPFQLRGESCFVLIDPQTVKEVRESPEFEIYRLKMSHNPQHRRDENRTFIIEEILGVQSPPNPEDRIVSE